MRIQRYKQRVGLSSQAPRPQKPYYNPVPEAVNRVAQQAQQVVGLFAEKYLNAKISDEFHTAVSSVKKAQNDFNTNLIESPILGDDKMGIVEKTNFEVEKFNTQLYEEVRKGITTPEAQRRFEQFWTDTSEDFNQKHKYKAYDQHIRLMQNKLFDRLDTYIDDENGKEFVANEITNGVVNGLIDQVKGEELKESYFRQIDYSGVRKEAFNMGLPKAIHALRTGELGDELHPDDRIRLEKELSSILDKQQREYDEFLRREEKEFVNDITKEIVENGSIDRESLLKDPRFQRHGNIAERFINNIATDPEAENKINQLLADPLVPNEKIIETIYDFAGQGSFNAQETSKYIKLASVDKNHPALKAGLGTINSYFKQWKADSQSEEVEKQRELRSMNEQFVNAVTQLEQRTPENVKSIAENLISKTIDGQIDKGFLNWFGDKELKQQESRIEQNKYLGTFDVGVVNGLLLDFADNKIKYKENGLNEILLQGKKESDLTETEKKIFEHTKRIYETAVWQYEEFESKFKKSPDKLVVFENGDPGFVVKGQDGISQIYNLRKINDKLQWSLWNDTEGWLVLK